MVNSIKIVDFGLSENFYLENIFELIDEGSQEKQPPCGTYLYGSIAQNLGQQVGKKDDMESCIYCIMRLLLVQYSIKHLPW